MLLYTLRNCNIITQGEFSRFGERLSRLKFISSLVCVLLFHIIYSLVVSFQTNKTASSTAAPPPESSEETTSTEPGAMSTVTTEETTLETEPYTSTVAGSTTVLPLAGTTVTNSDETRDEPDTPTQASSTASTKATTQTTVPSTTTTEVPVTKPQIFQDVPTYKRKGM